MKRRPRSKSAHFLMPKYRAASVMFAALLSISGGLLLMERLKPDMVSAIRTQLADVTLPVLSTLASPIASLNAGVDWIAQMLALRQENLALKAANAELLQWQAEAHRMHTENAELRALLQVIPEGRIEFITAKLVGGGTAFKDAALINAGMGDGVERHQAVVSREGLVGRVVEAGTRSARVLLVTDSNSHIPVRGERSRTRAIASGKGVGNQRLGLDYLMSESSFIAGERLVTSGDGGMIPANIPVAVVTSVKQGVAVIEPLADPTKLEHVTVLKYEF